MTKRVVFSQNQINEIIEKYQSGQGCTTICKDYNVSQQTINRLLIKNNVIVSNRKHHFNENIFDKIDSAEKAYWLGFIVADGYVNEDRGFLIIKLNAIDKEHLYKFMNFISGEESMIKTEYHNITGNELCKIELNSRNFINKLVKLNLRQGKSSGKEQLTPNIPETYIRDYIRGLWDGDGHIEYKELDLISSIEVLTFVQKYFNKIFDSPINKICNHCNTYRIFICNKRFKILKFLYYKNCIALNRKYNLANNLIEVNNSLIELEANYKKERKRILGRLE